jgi:hypothetical protein
VTGLQNTVADHAGKLTTATTIASGAASAVTTEATRAKAAEQNNAAAAAAAQTLAASAVPVSKVGSAGGVAALDNNGRVIAPVAGDASSAQLDSDTTGAQAVARLKTVESGVTGLQNTVADHAGKLTTATTIASGAASAVTTEATRAKAAEQSNAAAAAAAQTLAASAVPVSKVGSAGGVAALDNNGRVIAPVAGDASSAQLDSDTTGAQAVARLKTVENGVTGLQNTVADHAGKLTTAITIASGAASAVTTEATRAKAVEQSNAAAAAAAQMLAASAVPVSKVGSAGGVAALDNNGRVIAPVAGDASSAQLDSDTTGAQAVARLKTVESGVTNLQGMVTDQGAKLSTAASLASSAVQNAKVGAANGVAALDADQSYAGSLKNPEILGGMVTNVSITTPGAYAPGDLPVKITMASNPTGEAAAVSVTYFTAVSARVAVAGSNCSADDVFTIAATGTQILVSDGNGLAGATVSIVNGGSAAVGAVPANPVSVTAAETACTPPKFNLSWGVQSVSLDNQGWGYASPPSGMGSVSTAPDAAIAMVGTAVQTGVVSLPDKLVAASRVGAAGGVAGLDGSGNVTSGVKAPSLFAGKLQSVSNNQTRNYKASFFSNVNDYPTSPNSILFGGHQNWDDAYIKIIGQTIGHGDSGGAIVSEINSPNTTFSNRNGAGSSDGIIHYFGLDNASPRLSIGQDIISSDGNIYTVREMSNDHITITPSLSDAAKSAFSPLDRIYSNYKTGNIISDTSAAHPFVTPNLYYTYYKGMSDSTYTDSSGKTTTSTVIQIIYNPDKGSGASGWTTQKLSGVSASASYPGNNPGDYIDNTSDTNSDGIVYNYPNSAIFVGSLGQNQFLMNSYINGSGSQKDSPYRSQSGIEWDYNLAMKNDYDMKFTGEAFSVNSHGHRFADGSYDLYLGGTGVPSMLRIGSDAEATNIDSLASWFGAYGFGDDNSNNADYRSVMSEITKYMGPNSSNGQTSSGHRLSLYTSLHRMVANTDTSHINPADVALEIGVAEDMTKPAPRTSDANGNFGAGADLEKIAAWNGNWYICNKGQEFDSLGQLCTVTIKNSGTYINNGDLNVLAGNINASGAIYASGQLTANKNLVVRGVQYFQDSSAKNSAQISTGSDGTITFVPLVTSSSFQSIVPLKQLADASFVNASITGNLVSNYIRSTSGVSPTYANYAYSKLPTSGLTDGQHARCSDCKLNGKTGVDAVWNAAASRWTDSQNNDLTTN